MKILSKLWKYLRPIPVESEEILYNLTAIYKAAGRNSSAFSFWKTRNLDPYARLHNYKIIINRGNSYAVGMQGTFTNSKECYELTKKWANKESIVTFKRAEYQFEDDILKNLFGGYKILPQYQCCSGMYRIDWYIPELNLAIEFDEPGHNNKLEEDSIRQHTIENTLQCKFLRYTYNYNEK